MILPPRLARAKALDEARQQAAIRKADIRPDWQRAQAFVAVVTGGPPDDMRDVMGYARMIATVAGWSIERALKAIEDAIARGAITLSMPQQPAADAPAGLADALARQNADSHPAQAEIFEQDEHDGPDEKFALVVNTIRSQNPE